MNHYEWLEENLPIFFERIGLTNYIEHIPSIVSCDGDKCYCYEYLWEKANIPFCHGVALYLITKISPYNKEVRETSNGWVEVSSWIITNYQRFIDFLPKAE